MPVAKALETLQTFAGRQFDPHLVDLMKQSYDQGEIHDDISRSTPTIHELIEKIQ
jgi:response regulator RpfG family c-di-GMP phosphodiesterase